MLVQSIPLQQRKPKTTAQSKPPRQTSKLPAITQRSQAKPSKIARSTQKSKVPLPAVASSEKQQAKTVELSVLEIAQQRLSEPPIPENKNCGNVIIRYNHYHKLFPILNGVLKWEDVDKEYFLSFAFKGNYRRSLLPLPALSDGENLYRRNANLFAVEANVEELRHDENYLYFIGATNDTEYLLRVEEDIDSIKQENNKPILASTLASLHNDAASTTVHSGNRAVQLLTEELKQLAPDSLSSAVAKDLIVRRDLEDVLFSS